MEIRFENLIDSRTGQTLVVDRNPDREIGYQEYLERMARLGAEGRDTFKKMIDENFLNPLLLNVDLDVNYIHD